MGLIEIAPAPAPYVGLTLVNRVPVVMASIGVLGSNGSVARVVTGRAEAGRDRAPRAEVPADTDDVVRR